MKTLIYVLLMGCTLSTFAQHNIPVEDHFWRRRVVRRIDMKEKVNAPMVAHADHVGFDPHYSEHNGIVVALLNGLKKGRYLAYHPDRLDKTMTYQQVLERMHKLEAMSDEELPGEGGIALREETVQESLDEFALADDANKRLASVLGETAEDFSDVDMSAYEEVFHFIEDIIFDKNSSRLVYDIDFFQIVWSDPRGVLPERVLAHFKYDDVEEVLRQTRWENRFNDAKARSMKEIFDLRLFHAIIIDVSGQPVYSLLEAEDRRQEIIEFESNLWSY